jgi:hypothetical protein
VKIEKSKPFSSGTEYECFRYKWCERCTHYKVREDDGFPEFPERGGCRILDLMERARFDEKWWPCKKIVTEKCENGDVKYWHKCTEFMRNKEAPRWEGGKA